MAQELIPVNIVIGDRTYRIKALPTDEEAIRRTVKIINEKIIDFKTQFGGKDMQDYIAMVMIWYATQGGDHNNTSVTTLREALNRIEEQLDKVI